jgi:hypothetical protein
VQPVIAKTAQEIVKEHALCQVPGAKIILNLTMASLSWRKGR